MEGIFILLGISAFFLFSSLLTLLFRPYSGYTWQRVRRIQLLDLPEEAKEMEEQPVLFRLMRPVYELVRAKVKVSRISAESIQAKLEQAGLNYAPEQFMAAKWMAGLGTMLAGTLVVLAQQRAGSGISWIMLAVGAYFLPDIVLRGKLIRRRDQVMEEFPDFIDATRSYLSSGLSIYQTIKQVQEIAGPGMGELLEKLSAELEVYDQVTALRRFAHRAGLLEVQNFVVTIEQGINAGIPLKDIFLAQSQLMRELRKLGMKRKIKQKPAYMALVGGLLFINIFIIVGLPALLTIMAMRGIGD
ncbi:MAG: type II secretion system F family protein [Clostridia bacterium]|nr:type II secretion system F family protein [Clostridia bacterium]